MENANPYSAPKARVAGARDAEDSEHGEINLLTSRGRIGRLRFVAYTAAFPIIAMALFAIFLPFLQPALGKQAFMIVMTSVYLLAFFFVLLLTVQRLHDMNRSGWFALLVMVPVVNLILYLLLYFFPGSRGRNDYGAAPPPNGLGIVVAAGLIVLVFVVGIIAAIALPAYQNYLKRAQVQQTQ